MYLGKLALAVSAIATIAFGCGSDGSSSNGVATSRSTLTAADQSQMTSAHAGFLARLSSSPAATPSTVPPNGDVNPYGIAFVPRGFPAGGILRAGDIVVSNFNAASNLQGTGTTIVRVNDGASPDVFFADTRAPGFSTALGVLRRGFVLVGYVPSTDGSGSCMGAMDNVGQGALFVIDRAGNLAATLASASELDGPWDLAVEDEGERARVFVSNVKSGTVTRLDLRVDTDDGVFVEGETTIASGYAHRCDPAAFVVGPTGLALDREHEVLYVASAADNAIFAVDDATDTRRDQGMGRTVVSDATHLHGPLGLVRTREGHLISAQGDAVNPDPNQPSEIVEFTAGGRFVAERSVDSASGSAFGLALEQRGDDFRFTAVDDGQNVLDVWSGK
jgi:DNA-binding beta-propeller fold protein YncE